MLWCEFRNKLKKINPRFWVTINDVVRHPEYPEMRICAIYYDKVHICSCTYDSIIPYESDYDKEGVILHQGLKDIVKNLFWAIRKNPGLGEIVKKKDIQKHFKINSHRIELDR